MRLLRRGPGMEWSAIVAAVGHQGGVDADSVAAGGGVQRDVDRDAIVVSEVSALIEAERGVGISQIENGDAAALQFLAEAAGERDGDVFFEKGGAESFAAVVAAVAGVDHGEIAVRDWRRPRWHCNAGRRRWSGRGNYRLSGRRGCGRDGDGASVGAETS